MGLGSYSARRRKPELVQRVDDLFGRAAPEVRDRVQLGLRALDQVAHRLDAGALEAVVGADADLELLDQAVVAVGDRGRRRRGIGGERVVVVTRGELLDAVGVGEDRERLDQDLGRLAKRRAGLDGAVGLDLERELVEVRALPDSGGVHRVGGAADRREDRVDRDHSDGLVLGLVLLGGRVAAAAADRQVHLELGLLLERRDRRLGVQDLDARGQVDVLGGDLAGAGGHQRRLDLVGVGVHPDDDVLEVQDDVGHVLLDPLDRRELVGDALDADAGDRGASERGEQHAAKAVAEGVAEPLVEGLDRERALVLGDVFLRDLRDLEFGQGGHSISSSGS